MRRLVEGSWIHAAEADKAATAWGIATDQDGNDRSHPSVEYWPTRLAVSGLSI